MHEVEPRARAQGDFGFGTAVSGVWSKVIRKFSEPSFHRQIARVPILRSFAAREGAAMFDVVAGFVKTQVLRALIEARILERLLDEPMSRLTLAQEVEMPAERLQPLLQAGAALKLITWGRDGLWRLCPRGAALLGVPGLVEMIKHHDLLYDDMRDPLAFWRDDRPGQLAAFWPYVFGGEGCDPRDVERYSKLMRDTQSLVVDDLLRVIDFSKTRALLDIGGGSGSFISRIATQNATMRLGLFDLPEVTKTAQVNLPEAILARTRLHGGNFRQSALPEGYDRHTLIRVLFDHQDDIVAALLAQSYAALPSGGTLVICEPMSGGARADGITDTYFAAYTRAMGTGKTRSAQEIAALCRAAGFDRIGYPKTLRSFVATSLMATKK